MSTASPMSTASALQAEEIVPADAVHSVGEEASSIETTSAPHAAERSETEIEAEVKAEEEWYKALYEEDSKRLLELLNESADLKLWKRGWEEEPERQVRGRPRNYWEKETQRTWMGRTALHVGARRGNAKLLKHLLHLCKEEEETDGQLSIMEDLFSAKDGDYELDAIAIAVLNGNEDVVTTLLEAGWHHPPVRQLYRIQTTVQSEERKEVHMQELQTIAEHREKFRTITEEIIEDYKGDPQFQAAVLRRYRLHRDYNFWPFEEYPEYLFHFLFTRFEAVEDDFLDYYLASKINVLILMEIVDRASMLSSAGLLEHMWAMQDGQGRPPLHVAGDEERSYLVLWSKKVILTREGLSVDPKILRRISRVRDGAGRTTVQRTAIRGRKMSLICFSYIWYNRFDGAESIKESYDLSHVSGNGRLAELAEKYESSLAPSALERNDRFPYSGDAEEEEPRSSWASYGVDYAIDLGHLSERNGFCGQFWPNCRSRLNYQHRAKCRPIHRALILYNDVIRALFETFDSKADHVDPLWLYVYVTDAEMQLPLSELGSLYDINNSYQRSGSDYFPIFIAAAMGKYDVLQALIHDGVRYDPLQEDSKGNTSLHYAVKGMGAMMNTLMNDPVMDDPFLGKNGLLSSLRGLDDKTVTGDPLPVGIHLCSFLDCEHISRDSKKLRERWTANCERLLTTKEVLVGSLLVERQGCINFLIQQGCDIFKTNDKDEVPYPSGDANSEFLRWWHEKQLKEFQTAQSAQSFAANAISITAALVATASYVGPLQPPLGYSDDNPTQLRLDITAVKVFIVCDTLSFYLAIAAIIYALVPCLPIPQQSITRELRRTRRLVNIAVIMLFPSIICVLVAFAAGSIAIIQTNQTKWNYGGLTIGTAVFGGLACFSAIVTFSNRLIAIIFHRKNRKWIYTHYERFKRQIQCGSLKRRLKLRARRTKALFQ